MDILRPFQLIQDSWQILNTTIYKELHLTLNSNHVLNTLRSMVLLLCFSCKHLVLREKFYWLRVHRTMTSFSLASMILDAAFEAFLCSSFWIKKEPLKSKLSVSSSILLHPVHDPLQNPFGLTHGKVSHVIVLWSQLHQPISLDVSTGPNVILCCQDKLIVQHPFWLVVQARWWMKLYNLIVLDCEIVSRPFQMCYLHKKSCH